MAWIRIDADLDLHPDLDDAAPYALDVFQAVVRVAKAHGWAGVVKQAFTAPRYLCKRMRWGPDREEAVASAFRSLVAIGWLDQDAENTIIPRWNRFQDDPTHADRSAAYRARKALAAQETRITPSESDGARRVVTAVTTTGRDGTGRDRRTAGVPNGTPRAAGAAAPLAEPTPDAAVTTSPSRNGTPKATPRPSAAASEVAEVYTHYRQRHPKAAPRLSSETQDYRRILAALKRGHSVADLCRAIDGYHRSPWHLGENDRGKPYLSLGLIFRDEDHILAGIEMADDPDLGRAVNDKTRRTYGAAARFAEGGPVRDVLALLEAPSGGTT